MRLRPNELRFPHHEYMGRLDLSTDVFVDGPPLPEFAYSEPLQGIESGCPTTYKYTGRMQLDHSNRTAKPSQRAGSFDRLRSGKTSRPMAM